MLFYELLQVFIVGAAASTAVAHHEQRNALLLGLNSSSETIAPTKLEISGKIPQWISGSLYRGASGTWDAGNYTSEHWFDGFSRNHRFEIGNGSVVYRSRNASDELFDFVRETGRYPGGSFGGDPCKVIFGAFETTYRDASHQSGDRSSDNVGVAYIPNFPGLASNSSHVHGRLVTLVHGTDANDYQQLDPVTLEPIELFTDQAYIPSFTDSDRSAAHGVMSKGSYYNYNLNGQSLEKPTYQIFEIDPTGKGRILANITDAPAAYIHSVFHTENYLIMIIWQADLGRKTSAPTYNLLDTLKPWNASRETLFYVLEKMSGRIVSKYASETFFAFHQINCYEDDGDDSIVIDLPTMPNYDFLEAARIPNLRANLFKPNHSSAQDIPGTFTRYRLPHYKNDHRSVEGALMSRKAVVDFTIPYRASNIELPRINEAYSEKEYQFVYGIHIEKPGFFTDSLIKIDTRARTSKLWIPCGDHVPSEPVFVARPNGTAEDDGILMTVALSAERRVSSLIFIDAASMEEIAQAELPVVMQYGFHGFFSGTL